MWLTISCRFDTQHSNTTIIRKEKKTMKGTMKIFGVIMLAIVLLGLDVEPTIM